MVRRASVPCAMLASSLNLVAASRVFSPVQIVLGIQSARLSMGNVLKANVATAVVKVLDASRCVFLCCLIFYLSICEMYVCLNRGGERHACSTSTALSLTEPLNLQRPSTSSAMVLEANVHLVRQISILMSVEVESAIPIVSTFCKITF